VSKIRSPFCLQDKLLTKFCSQILLPSNKHSHHPRLPRTLPYGLGRSLFHHSSATETSKPALCDSSRAGLWTIRKAEEEAIRRARLQIRLAQRTTGGEANAAVKAVDDVVDGEGDLAMLDGIEDFGGEGEEESDG
jgi:hypothetical protein